MSDTKTILPDAEKIAVKARAFFKPEVVHTEGLLIEMVERIQFDAIRAFCDEVERRCNAYEDQRLGLGVIKEIRRELGI